MKYLVYAILALISGALFLPRSGTTEIRNQPLLIVVLSLIFILILIRIFKYVFLMAKTKKLLKENGKQVIQTRFLPWASLFHGQYSITFQSENQVAQIVLISRKRKYQRYHFDSISRLEFYRANRVVFRSIRVEGGTISNLVEINQIGKQSIKWDDTAKIRIIVFDQLPDSITDSAKKETLANRDRICGTEVCVFDFAALSDHIRVTAGN